jgi:hypothetical protein
MPKGRVPVDFGIPEEFPKDFIGQLTHPFARAFRRKETGPVPVAPPSPQSSVLGSQ